MRPRPNLPTKIALAITAVMVLGWTDCPGQSNPAEEYLSDQLASRIVSSTQGWGELGFNTAVRPAGRSPTPLQIGERTYRKGLGHHAPGEIIVDLGGQFLSFQADVGIQWQGGGTAGSVGFQVFVDDKELFNSGVVRDSDAPRAVKVPLVDAQELRLVVTDAGDGITCDCADWADARLTRNPAAKASPAPSVNIAAFGRIMSWDPARRTGTSANRVGEFPAEDVEPGCELAADADGNFLVTDWNGRGCIGAQWYESRTLRQLELEFADAARVPSAESISLEIWTGESAWQGQWERINGTVEKQGNRLRWVLDRPGGPRPTTKIRWCFASGAGPLRVKTVAALTRSRWKPVDLEIASVANKPAERVSFELYNGDFVESRAGASHLRTWDPSQPLKVTVLASAPRADKTDRTVLRFASPEPGFAVAIEDVLARGEVVYAGIRVSSPGNRATASTPSAAGESILAEVRKRPDQTLDQALAVTHVPIQDQGPMMLSLACDNRKLVADRDGTVHFDSYDGLDDPPRPFPEHWQLKVRRGDKASAPVVSRRLQGGWLPIPETVAKEGSVVYRQACFVAPVGAAKPDLPAWVRDRALGVVEFTIRNEGQAAAGVRLGIGLTGKANASVQVEAGDQHHLLKSDGRVLAIVDSRSAAPLQMKSAAAGVDVVGELPPGGTARCSVLIPCWKLHQGEESALLSSRDWSADTKTYWDGLLKDAMRVEVPDEFLTNLIRASQVHCFLAARSESGGRRVAPWISSDRYGPLESEANAVIRGMDLLGQTEFARRGLEFFIERYDPRGFLTTGYTLVGTGEHLWTLAEHLERTPNRAWLERNAPGIIRVCDWIAAQRAKTKRQDAHGRNVPEYGLMPPGVTADWNRFAYRFFNDAQYCAGLEAVSRLLAGVNHPRAGDLKEEARRYKQDLFAAYHWTQARSPVVWLGGGTWGLSQPALLDSFGRVEEFLPGEDGNRSWAYSVELGAHHLAALGILDPASPEVSDMLQYLEGFQFLRTGMGEYPEETNRRDPFNLGGFAKVQPFYARIAEIYAPRDEVKPFVRAYFNALASLVSRENMSLWEHFHNQGGWNKTHETGWFLCQSRMMFVQERGPDLWLAPMATDRWLRDGKEISVRAAPTRFGKVGFTIRPAADAGSVDVEVLPPSPAKGLRRIVVRVNHPEGKRIRAVTLSGRPHTDFNVEAQTVNLPPAGSPLTLHIDY